MPHSNSSEHPNNIAVYIDHFISLLIVIGLILVIFAGLRLLAGKDVVPKKTPPPPPKPLEVDVKNVQPLDSIGGQAFFMEFRGMMYVVVKSGDSMVLLETIRQTPPPKDD